MTSSVLTVAHGFHSKAERLGDWEKKTCTISLSLEEPRGGGGRDLGTNHVSVKERKKEREGGKIRTKISFLIKSKKLNHFFLGSELKLAAAPPAFFTARRLLEDPARFGANVDAANVADAAPDAAAPVVDAGCRLTGELSRELLPRC